MTDTLHLITDSLHCNQTGILTLATDTLKIYNVPSFQTGFKWTDYLKPSIDLLLGLIGAFILVGQYLIQKRKEAAARIIENKRDAYSEFLKDFTETAVKIMHDKNAEGIKHDRERMLARNKLLLYGNDKVIQAYHNWVEFSDKPGSDVNEEVKLFGKLLLEIRKDIHGNSKVTEEEISNLNPFNRG